MFKKSIFLLCAKNLAGYVKNRSDSGGVRVRHNFKGQTESVTILEKFPLTPALHGGVLS